MGAINCKSDRVKVVEVTHPPLRLVEQVELGPPLLYTLTCNGHWEQAVTRCKTHPEEARWQDDQGGTALHAACFMIAPVRVIQALIIANPSTSSTKSEQGATPLHIACLRGASADVVRALRLDCPPSAAMVDAGQGTPLHIATSRYGYESASIDVLRLLVNAYPNAVTRRNDRGKTPLDFLGDEYNGMINQCLSGIDFNADVVSIGLLARAATEGHVDCRSPLVECWEKFTLFILAAYASTNSAGDKSALLTTTKTVSGVETKVTLLLHACAGVHECPAPFLRLALKILSGQLSQRDAEGNMPLHVAASMSETHSEATKAIIYSSGNTKESRLETIVKAYPAAVKEVGKDRKLPLIMAFESGRTWYSGGVRTLFMAHPSALLTMDIDIRLCPKIFALIGAQRSPLPIQGRSTQGMRNRKHRQDSPSEVSSIQTLSIMFEIISSKPDIFRYCGSRCWDSAGATPSKHRSKLRRKATRHHSGN